MDHKQLKSKKYEKGYKDTQKTQSQSDILQDKIGSMTPQRLIEFIDEEYSKIQKNNEKLVHKMNCSISDRLRSLRKEIQTSQMARLDKFLALSNDVMDQKDKTELVNLISNNGINFQSICDKYHLHIQIYIEKGVRFVSITKHNSQMRRLFLLKITQEKYTFQPSFKRMKKEGREICENLKELIEILDSVIEQNE